MIGLVGSPLLGGNKPDSLAPPMNEGSSNVLDCCSLSTVVTSGVGVVMGSCDDGKPGFTVVVDV